MNSGKRWREIVHWSATGVLSLVLLLFAGMYVFNHTEVGHIFEDLGFPEWIVYPLAIVKLAAVIVLLSKFDKALTEWAYAGVFFNLVLGAGAHLVANDGQYLPAILCIGLLLLSYFTWDKKEA